VIGFSSVGLRDGTDLGRDALVVNLQRVAGLIRRELISEKNREGIYRQGAYKHMPAV